MALPEFTQRLAEERLTAYCERKVPPLASNQMRLSFAIRGTTVTLSEERVVYDQPGQWTSMPIAQFRFDPTPAHWTLYCSDRNNRWHRYRHAVPAKDIDALIHAMDTDKTGIFWG